MWTSIQGLLPGHEVPVEMFPVLFAIPRTAGWIAQWVEMLQDPDQKMHVLVRFILGTISGITGRLANVEGIVHKNMNQRTLSTAAAIGTRNKSARIKARLTRMTMN